MADALETGIYLLTATHVGTGRAAGAIDLPIARERHTGHPLLPASALKGVARDLFENPKSDNSEETVKKLFGPRPPQKDQPGEPLHPGDLVFTDGHLLAFPVRSLSAAFYWVTCPLVIARWRRLRRAWGLPAGRKAFSPEQPLATFSHRGPLVLEDHAIDTSGFGPSGHAELQLIAEAWKELVPGDDEVATALPSHLVCVSDADFAHLVGTCTNVNARVQLTPGKTTDRWESDDGKSHEGNLWYEETLPADCLFSVLIAARDKGKVGPVSSVLKAAGRRVQIGGNETVGQGIAWWRPGEVSGG